MKHNATRRILTIFLAFVLVLGVSLPAFAADPSAAPAIHQPYEGDTTVTGTGVTGAQVGVLLPDGSWPVAVVDAGGQWSVATDPLAAGDRVFAQQFETSKTASEVVGVQVLAQDPVSATPTIDPIYAGDATVTGTGVTGAQIGISFPDGSWPVVVVDGDGKWSVDAPMALAQGNVVRAQQFEAGKTGSAIASVTVMAQLVSQMPSISPIHDDDTYIYGGGIPESTIEVIFPGNIVETTTVANTRWGDWELQIPSTVLLREGDIIYAVQIEIGKQRSEPAFTTVDRWPQVMPSEPPQFDALEAGDTHVTGRGIPGSWIIVRFEDGQEESGQVGSDGTWSVPAWRELRYGEVLWAWQIEQGKHASEEVSTTVWGRDPVSKKPIVYPVYQGVTKVEGEGVPGATIMLRSSETNPLNTIVDETGFWSIAVPSSFTFRVGDDIVVFQIEPGKEMNHLVVYVQLR